MPVDNQDSITSLSFTSKEMLCEDNITFQDDKLKEHRESTLKYPGALLIIIHLEYWHLAFFPLWSWEMLPGIHHQTQAYTVYGNFHTFRWLMPAFNSPGVDTRPQLDQSESLKESQPPALEEPLVRGQKLGRTKPAGRVCETKRQRRSSDERQNESWGMSGPWLQLLLWCCWVPILPV